MEIKKSAIAGTLESSDAQVTVMPATNGVDLNIQSSVMNRFGRQIKQTILDTLNNLNVKNGKIVVVDKGALDCTLKARVEGTVFRSCGQSTKNIPWGDLK
ncbi:citrate lyase acyl carrier protein [Loigolactobacillus coryniformis]|uniref:citrate lyase acyl carrier protein n=1 Tax=Loigolactobacillus coryniformis TaxID=1610 RepID=UPI003F1F9009